MPDSCLKPICLWSGPRNVSTALMYSVAQLDDVRVIDEPLYGHYLAMTGAEHPGRDVVVAAMNCNGQSVMEKLIREQAQYPSPRLFLKHMAHHLVSLDTSFLLRTVNVFLIRDPQDMLPSLTVQLPQAELADTGLKRQCELFDWLCAQGQQPVVLDSRQLLSNPPRVLEQLCAATGLKYSDRMLRWPAGPRPEDGVWAPHWYDAVHRSTGFSPYRAKGPLPARLQSLWQECEPWYRHLYDRALCADEPSWDTR